MSDREPRPLDVLTCDLDGIRLIEASAGTGKTWNICGLVLRLLLERRLRIGEILVVTFTKAATAELRDRIRQRLVETREHLEGRVRAGDDPLVPDLLDRLRREQPGEVTDRERLAVVEAALESFDEAAIFTIHGFCQRALADAAFAAQAPMRSELLPDDGDLVRLVVNDFWRRRVAADGVAEPLIERLLVCGDSPERFARLLRRRLDRPRAMPVWPRDIDGLEPDPAALRRAFEEARSLWETGRGGAVDALIAGLPRLDGRRYSRQSVDAGGAEWNAAFSVEDALRVRAGALRKAGLFCRERLEGALKKASRQEGAPVHPFFEAAQRLVEAIESFDRALGLARLRLLRDLLDEAPPALREEKRRRRVVSYDDMLSNLASRLESSQGDALARVLRARFPAALIDEFQDTDPLQFEIFQRIYGADSEPRGQPGQRDSRERRPEPAGPVFFVGDPKQSIYGFRNADLQTYLRARSVAAAEYTLSENQRSSKELLKALNRLFSANPRMFMLEGLGYREVGCGRKRRKSFVDLAGDPAPLQVWELPGAEAATEMLTTGGARNAAAQATAAEIVRLLSDSAAGRVTLDGEPLDAGSIAVLVRTHAEGGLVRQALAERGVGSVERSRRSVFATPDAEAIEHVLAAANEPARDALVRAALATEAMGFDAADIAALVADDSASSLHAQRFAELRRAWTERGVAYMLRSWLGSEGIVGRLLARPDGERRVTNLLHLFECLHEAGAEHASPDALLRWLRTRRVDPGTDDEAQVRLESDENLVQIVTIHVSKGLEYPVVFCPFLWTGPNPGGSDTPDARVYHADDGALVFDFREGLDDAFELADVKARQRLERSSEFLRLVYVALTRAVHRCVLVAGVHLHKNSPRQSARSLLNWMVVGAGRDPAEWLDADNDPPTVARAWRALAQGSDGRISVSPLPPGDPAPLLAGESRATGFAALEPPSPLPGAWRIGSYSALTHGAIHDRSAADHDFRVAGAGLAAATTASDTDTQAPATDADVRAPSGAPFGFGAGVRSSDPLKTSEQTTSNKNQTVTNNDSKPGYDSDSDDILDFPRGPAAGDCVHAVLELADFTDPESWPAAIEAALDGLPLMPGDPRDPTGRTELRSRRGRMLGRMLGDLVATPLPIGTDDPLRLEKLPPARRLNEMEFHLPTRALRDRELGAFLDLHGYPGPRLGFTPLEGFLKGFVDMVFEHEGRYFVLDWKSNHLGRAPADYGPGPMGSEMARHGYHLQSLLYAVALHRHLGSRLADYDPIRHFGGTVYLFIRGVRPGWRTDGGVASGVWFHRPHQDVIAGLDAMFLTPEADDA